MKVVATVTTTWGQRGYTSVPIHRVEDYAIDSAMDTDADQFSIDIGDPNAQFMSLFRRDGEIRISLAAAYDNLNFIPLLKGFVDTAAYTHDGTLSLTGRDLSAAAIDDTALPFTYRVARPEKIIAQQARDRGMKTFGGALAVPGSIAPIRNLFTDGSESVWAFWYRMVRKRQMWIWVSSDGTLFVDRLNYGAKPTYLFGWPTPEYPNPQMWIPVMEAEENKNTQTRLWQAWVFGDTGTVSFPPVKVSDPKLDSWIKRPISIVPAQAGIINRGEAVAEAQENLFEGMVGEIEIVIRISDPGFIIKQNTVALLNIPKMGLSGEYFVVGVRLMGGNTGAIQEIRLREKKYALTRRVPEDPIVADDSQNLSANTLGAALGVGNDWGEYFVVAAQAFHGPWDFSTFLAALLAICDTETGFRNIREGDHTVWFSKPTTLGALAILLWEKGFANNQNNPWNPFYPARGAGVGPMQLTDLSDKLAADDRFGLRDEYAGGRWDPASNIWAGAQALLNKLQKLPVSTDNFWVGVQGYNGYPDGVVATGAYSDKIKALVKNTYQKAVTKALKDSGTLPANSTKTIKDLGPNTPDAVKKIINYAERQLGKAYQWGADGPDTYDCSGLVYASYKAAGLDSDIGGRQDTWGYWGNHWITPKPVFNLVYVTLDALNVGDMVFFNILSEQDPPQHMGIYYGDGQMIVAPSAGQVVQIQSISAPGYWLCLGGKRVNGLWPEVTAPNHPGPN